MIKQPPRCRGLQVTAAVLLAVSGVSACESAAEAPSPPPRGDEIVLSGEADAGELCLPASSKSNDMSFGMETVTVAGDEPVELVSVHLVGAKKFELVKAYVAPEAVRGQFGGRSGWPGAGVSKRTVEALLPVPGAVVEPAQDAPEGEKQPGLILHLRGTAGASFEGLTIDYRVQGTEQVLRTDRSHQRMSVKDRCNG